MPSGIIMVIQTSLKTNQLLQNLKQGRNTPRHHSYLKSKILSPPFSFNERGIEMPERQHVTEVEKKCTEVSTDLRTNPKMATTHKAASGEAVLQSSKTQNKDEVDWAW